MPRSRKRPALCLCGKCGLPATRRGLSSSCYQAALRDINKGKTTWEALIARRKALPAIPAHQRRRSGIGEVIDELAASHG